MPRRRLFIGSTSPASIRAWICLCSEPRELRPSASHSLVERRRVREVVEVLAQVFVDFLLTPGESRWDHAVLAVLPKSSLSVLY